MHGSFDSKLLSGMSLPVIPGLDREISEKAALRCWHCCTIVVLHSKGKSPVICLLVADNTKALQPAQQRGVVFQLSC